MDEQQRALDLNRGGGTDAEKNGAEVSRTQQTMEIMAKNLGCRTSTVMC